MNYTHNANTLNLPSLLVLEFESIFQEGAVQDRLIDRRVESTLADTLVSSSSPSAATVEDTLFSGNQKDTWLVSSMFQ